MQNLSNENDTIQLCGLLWDALNFSKYLDLETAWDIGETIGKRLPTAEEWQALCDLGSTWDDERKGRWFGGNHDTDRQGSLFLPADGVRHSYNDEVGGEGTTGYYWSSENTLKVTVSTRCFFSTIPKRIPLPICITHKDVRSVSYRTYNDISTQ